MSPTRSLLREDGSWQAAIDSAVPPGDPLAAQLGRPGLWRVIPIQGSDDRTLVRSFEVPPCAEPALDAALAWADATRTGRVPEDWAAPTGAAALGSPRASLAPEDLRVRQGGHIAQGELVHTEDRVAVVFGELARVPADLDGIRRAWVDELCLDAQARWHLVRLGVLEEDVVAEVDLTGAPSELLRPLLDLSVCVLCHVVAQLLPVLRLVVDPAVDSRVLELDPRGQALAITL